ncbi:sigma-70 family RNA polymerase sigma factor [Planctomycetota bacterium]|nr:sigma-70 family RNA polymerase sigma factor [Planctomycetota bacterium]MDC1043724.1 sigma-70 family RNA polymerase sigma factor [bacterium]
MTDADWSPDPTRLAAFDEGEWSQVEAAFAGRLLSYVSRRVADAEAREDVVQETFLGAVRGIGTFNPAYSFEQFLFGICRNRTIDQLRRHEVRGRGGGDDGTAASFDVDSLASDDQTPSRIIRRTDLADRGRDLLAAALQEWVELTWSAGEMDRLMVVEGLLRGGMRNRDLWEPLGLRDEVSVAGIKFRALKKIRELLLAKDGAAEIAASLDGLAADADAPMDVQSVWGERRVSCPSRRWIARWLDGGLEPGAARFIAFHVDEVGCEWCEANRDDLTRAREQGRGEALEAVQGSSVRWLRSRAK